MIFSFIRSLFIKKRIEAEEVEKVKNFKTSSPDFIDYDGMGNYGRFPSKE